jgi:hypothetical protein
MMSLSSLTSEICGRKRVRRLHYEKAGGSPKRTFVNVLKINRINYRFFGQFRADEWESANWATLDAEITQF